MIQLALAQFSLLRKRAQSLRESPQSLNKLRPAFSETRTLEKFENEVISGGLIIYDSGLIDHPPTRSDVEVIALPATEMADKIGSAKSANMVALGALLGKTNMLDKDAVLDLVKAKTKKAELLDLNNSAVEAGFEFARANAAEENLWGV